MFRLLRARTSLAAGLAVLAVAFAACEQGDPLEAVRKQQEAGDFAGSLDPLRKLIAERPDDPEANYLYGVGLLYTAEPTLATFPLRKAMDDPAWLVPAGMQLAQAGLVSADFNEVVNATTRILEKHPEEVQALLFRAQARAHWRQDVEAALADANKVLELQPDMLEVYEPKILALLALDRKAEAREALAEAGRKLPDAHVPESVMAWHCSTTAVFAAEAGEVEVAREGFKKCLEQHPTDPTVVSDAMTFFDAHRDFESSLAAVRTAYEKSPKDRTLRFGLAERLRAAGKAGEGEALLRDATGDEDPRAQYVAWIDLARYRHGMREHASAVEAWERAVALMPQLGQPDPQVLFQYADALVISGQHDRALEIAEQISVPAQQHLIRGRVAQERRQYAKALAEFDEAIKVWPNNAFARYYTALAAERLGNFDRALEEYRYAIRTDVAATDARTRASRLLISEGQLLQAYQLLFLEVDKAPLDPEGELLSMYLMARVANPKQLQNALVTLRQRNPARYPLALARGAEGAAEMAGPRSALGLVSQAPGIDYTAPGSAPVLRAIVRFAYAAKQPAVADAFVTKALKAHPDAAVFHELRGLYLELGTSADAARAAYARALEIDPNDQGALAGLGRLTLASDPAKALEFFDRAAAVDPNDTDVQLGAARALRAARRPDEATRRLDVLLEQHPYVADAAIEAVAIDLERDAVNAKTLERAKRAVRFGGGLPAMDQLSQVHAKLGQAEDAARVAARAKEIRDQQEARSQAPAGPATPAPKADTAG
jgi:tetratricopeptide (TPR) repeat protein